MRDAFCKALLAIAHDPAFVFLTGDLGFKALEPLRETMGRRFINAGVAEQNMVTVAAGLAHAGLRPWAYSIAPFIYARPFEQIRNDVCLHQLPVVLVGNGGGYGYGVMGSTHHAIEDYGVLCTLPYLRAYIPAFDGDLAAIVGIVRVAPHPSYFRLGLSEQPIDYAYPGYAPWRKLLSGGGGTILAVGPLAGGILAVARKMPDSERPNVWLLCELPLDEIPAEFLDDARRNHLIVVEEHVATGGAGQAVALRLLEHGVVPARFTHRCARGYVSGRYGSQRFHRGECGLDAQSVIDALRAIPV